MKTVSDIRVFKDFLAGEPWYGLTWKYDGKTFQGPCDPESGRVRPWSYHPSRDEVFETLFSWSTLSGVDLDRSFCVEPCPEQFVPTALDFEDIVDNYSPTKPLGNYSTESRSGVFHDVWYSSWKHGYIRTEVAEFSRDPGKYWKLRRYFQPEEGLKSSHIEQVARVHPVPHWEWKKCE